MSRLTANQRFLSYAAPLATALLTLGAWQAFVVVREIPPYILPSPMNVLGTLISDWPELFRALLMTLKVALIAFVCAVVGGVAVAVLFNQSRWIEMSLFPYAVILQVTPIVAIAPLIIIWVREPQIALILCATIIAIFPIISNTTMGLRSVNPNLLSLFQLYRASRWQVLTRLRAPSALPYFFGGLRISSGLALVGAVVAEFVAGVGGTSSGLAYEILQSGYNLQIPRMFAALLLITAAGVALFVLMVWLSRVSLSHWHESEREGAR
jgi:NitT/TauT family transport system permease protein